MLEVERPRTPIVDIMSTTRQFFFNDSMIAVNFSESPHKRLSLAPRTETQEPIKLRYLAEGNANIVYSFTTSAKDALPDGVRRKLLRLRKEKSFIQSTMSQLSTFQQEFVPLFRPENLIEQTLVAVDEALIRRLNQELEEHENGELRQALRHSDRLATDGYGLLMTDMTARHGKYLFEIKPKWLLQSPDAPNDFKRCRTCALRLQRAHASAGSAVIPKPGGFCPLSLVDEDIEERQRAFQSIIDAQAGDISKSSCMFSMMSGSKLLSFMPCLLHTRFFKAFIDSILVREVVNFLAEKGYQVLETLRKHQAHFDKHGLLNWKP